MHCNHAAAVKSDLRVSEFRDGLCVLKGSDSSEEQRFRIKALDRSDIHSTGLTFCQAMEAGPLLIAHQQRCKDNAASSRKGTNLLNEAGLGRTGARPFCRNAKVPEATPLPRGEELVSKSTEGSTPVPAGAR